ncbi:MAG: hypothetical protein IIA62_08210, partial [Nitrospinae bacterium]|nr:hypothetical protein [Nitrospinota bacterium]
MLSWLKNLKVGVKIGLGFFAIGLIFFINILFVLNLFKQTEALHDRVIELRTPTAHNSLMILNGVNRSLADLRGWMLLGKDKFKQGRLESWSEDIDLPRKTLSKLSANWTNPENVERFRAINEKLEELRKYQSEIESLPRISQ